MKKLKLDDIVLVLAIIIFVMSVTSLIVYICKYYKNKAASEELSREHAAFMYVSDLPPESTAVVETFSEETSEATKKNPKRADYSNKNITITPFVATPVMEIPESETGFEVNTAGPVMTGPMTILPQMQVVYEKNSDTVGWICLSDTDIDYPVVCCDDNKYYLDYDFYGNESYHGAIFMDHRCDIDMSDNIIIYGHKMQDGTMFAALNSYDSEEFYTQHRLIKFSTLYEDRTYEVISAFVISADDDFDFQNYVYFDEGHDFYRFYDEISRRNRIAVNNPITENDRLLTLVTCSYEGYDARFVVVARQI